MMTICEIRCSYRILKIEKTKIQHFFDIKKFLWNHNIPSVTVRLRFAVFLVSPQIPEACWRSDVISFGTQSLIDKN